MKVRYIYDGHIVGSGYLQVIPIEGNFVEFQEIGKIYRVTSVMFKTLLSGDVAAMIYLCDITPETEHRLRNY
jgi:hypothetical protein